MAPRCFGNKLIVIKEILERSCPSYFVTAVTQSSRSEDDHTLTGKRCQVLPLFLSPLLPHLVHIY